MLTLIKNIECFCPRYIGVKDVLIGGGRIFKITPPGETENSRLIENTVDCTGLCAFPGFIDQHVHITGAGGEEGFHSRTKELEADSMFEAGITTAVGLLGADGTTRSMENLYAKAKSLENSGLTTYIYSGSYGVPPVTLTGSALRDLVLIDKVVGAGEIAIADHRSSGPDVRELMRLGSEVHLGGLLSGKAGIVHLHVGDGKGGLSILKEVLSQSDLPAGMFIPTHLNRNPQLFRQAVDYCRSGGRVDLTAGEKNGLSVADAVRSLISVDVDLSLVTISSDAGGSTPSGSTALPSSLFDDFVELLRQSVLPPAEAVGLFTENAAKALMLWPRKGVLQEGADADILITDKAYRLKMLICMGRITLNRSCHT